jgi:MarC family membrane protein
MLTELLSAVILLTLVVDPFGNVPLVNAMLATVPRERRVPVILREVAIATATLGVFMVFGREILQVMHLSETALSIAGGVILFMIAIRMVFGNPEGLFAETGAGGGEPFIVPLAIPLVAGPSATATVMLMATREPEKLGRWAIALLVSMTITFVVLATGERMQRVVGPRMMTAVERLMGLVLTAIAVEMLLDGFATFWKTLK